jgi:hypothetical protein
MVEKLKKDINWVEKVILSSKNHLQLGISDKCIDVLVEKWEKIPLSDDFGMFYLLNNEKIRLKNLIFDLKMRFLEKSVDIYSKN